MAQRRIFNNLSTIKVDLDKNNTARRIVCRFRSKEDLQQLGKKLGIKLDRTVREVNYCTKEVKYSKVSNDTGAKRNLDWELEWNELPEYTQEFLDDEYAKIDFIIDKNADAKEMFEQNITEKTKSIWYPKWGKSEHWYLRVLGGENPKYPVYIISKNRSTPGCWHTSVNFTKMGVPHYLVVEPQEYEEYKKNFENEYCTVIKLDMEYKTQYDVFNDTGNLSATGPGPARNFCWDHSIKNGFKWHWVFDDNVKGFYRFWRGRRIPCKTGAALRIMEEFVDRYDNIAIAGPNYYMFCADRTPRVPYMMNRRIYSMLLIRNDIPYRWRGRYNEDTDLSLRALKDGWTTVQFNLFLGDKINTQQIKGGNTAEFYAQEGTYNKSKMLVEMHPDVAKLVFRYGRWHHYVNYDIFKQGLHRKDGYNFAEGKIDEKGMYMIKIPEDLHNSANDTREYLEAHFKDSKNYLESTLYKE